MGTFDRLPTVDEMAAERAGQPCPKGQTRLQDTTAERKLTTVDEKAFRKAVIARDGHVCRKCLRKVIQTLARVPERLEVHHVHGRRGDLKFDDRASLVLCASCHEQVTGKVNERWVIVPTVTFRFKAVDLTDTRRPVVFKRVA